MGFVKKSKKRKRDLFKQVQKSKSELPLKKKILIQIYAVLKLWLASK